MFTFIITSNRVTKETTTTIDILLKTKLPQDVVMVINYSNYSTGYRNTKGIEYRHIKQSRSQAINMYLPVNRDVVILEDTLTITANFVKCLYKYYKPGNFYALRVDRSSSNGRFIESDIRIGSTITPKSFNNFAIVFNTGIIPKVGETAEETAEIANNLRVPLELLTNVRTTLQSKKPSSDSIGVTILIPSLKYKFSDDIKRDIRQNDRLYEFDSEPRAVTNFINKMMSESPNECVVIINPESSIHPFGMIGKIRNLYSGAGILFDKKENITNDAWLVVPKTKYTFNSTIYDTINQIHSSILSYNKDFTSYIEGDTKSKKSTNHINTIKYDDMISIIIPYMHLGDRWPLFEACMEKLYNCVKKYPNIEIIVHECGPRRYIKPEFVKLYDIEYMFSEYHGIFHRAWCLNVVSRFMAKGDTLVFFDGDLIVDDVWTKELLECDKTKAYVGWGSMINLTKEGTKRYLETKIISGKPERTRVPDSYGPAGGINVIPRDMFFNIGGWPESYKDMGYGGEDNSLAFKMDALEMYGEKMNKSIFSAPVHHLFHAHETKKDEARHPVFYKHFAYKKEDWFEHLRRNYKWGWPVDETVDLTKFKTYISEPLFYCYKHSKKVRLTVCMVNFLRYEKLISTLTTLLSFNIPLNLLLWVNQSDSMPPKEKRELEELLNEFSNHNITYCKKNLGVGYPRYMLNNKAKFEYETDYIVTMDDDTPHSSVESLVLGATILDQKEYSDYGAIGLWCNPHFAMIKVVDNVIKKLPFTEGFHTVDCLGSGTMTFRREVLDTCNYDPQYVMGLEDWDFSLSMKKNGWKLGLVCDPRYKPLNDTDDNSREYMIIRWDTEVIKNSRIIFKEKWGISGA